VRDGDEKKKQQVPVEGVLRLQFHGNQQNEHKPKRDASTDETRHPRPIYPSHEVTYRLLDCASALVQLILYVRIRTKKIDNLVRYRINETNYGRAGELSRSLKSHVLTAQCAVTHWDHAVHANIFPSVVHHPAHH
jgi:hypothetical protein